MHFALGQRLGLDRLLARIIELPRDDRWQTMARAALRDDLHAVHAQLTAEVLGADRAASSTATGAGDGLGEVQRGGAGVGEAAAVDHRAAGPTWPGSRWACGSSALLPARSAPRSLRAA